MQHEWNIKSRSECCQATGLPFVEGDYFQTLLFHDDEGYQRLDLSEAAWQERKNDASAPVPFSSWRSQYELPPPVAETIPRDDAEGMLRHLMKSSDPSHLKTAYVLGLMLERKKCLRPLPSTDPSTLLYEHIATGETFIIPDPHLSLEHLIEVQHEVAEILKTGIEVPGPY
ncbi:MAG: hypothetical protein ACH346_07420 [Chthoniobacterales bacterium]